MAMHASLGVLTKHLGYTRPRLRQSKTVVTSGQAASINVTAAGAVRAKLWGGGGSGYHGGDGGYAAGEFDVQPGDIITVRCAGSAGATTVWRNNVLCLVAGGGGHGGGHDGWGVARGGKGGGAVGERGSSGSGGGGGYGGSQSAGGLCGTGRLSPYSGFFAAHGNVGWYGGGGVGYYGGGCGGDGLTGGASSENSGGGGGSGYVAPFVRDGQNIQGRYNTADPDYTTQAYAAGCGSDTTNTPNSPTVGLAVVELWNDVA